MGVADLAQVRGRHGRMHPLAEPLLEHVEEVAARPGRRQVDALACEVELEPAGGTAGGRHDQVLGKVHPVAEVGEGAVRLERGELRAVPGVDPFVTEVAGYFEHSLVASDHQPLEVELRRDAQAELGVQRVGVGEERTGQGPSCLRLQDGGLDLHEALRLKPVPQDGQRPEADVEDAPAFLVGQQVNLPLAVPGLSVAQAVPLVGQRPERLGQDLQAAHVDRELASPAGDHLAGGSHPVAQVDERLDGGRVGRKVVGPEHQLNGPAGVLDGGEAQFAVAPQGGHPPGDARHLARPRVRVQPGVRRVQAGQRRAALEPGGIGVDAQGLQRIAVGPAFRGLRGQPSWGGRLGRLAALIGEDCGAHGGCPLGSARLFGADKSTVG